MSILVVEDDKEISKFLRTSLKFECFSVDTADDGEKGSYLSRTNDYDLVILDNLLPKKTGLEVCKDVRAQGKDMPILVLSIKSDTATKVDFLNAGADDYLSKPFSFEELLARIHALLRRPKKIESDVLVIGDLMLDSKKHMVRRGGREIYLTRKELMLLEYLIRNQGVVLSRGMILEHVWDMNTDLFSNTIESHILSLRRKVDRPGKKKIIHTIPGRGYKADLRKV